MLAEIKPFKGVRFTEKAGNISDLVCPPYDIISEEERKSFIQKNKYNIIRLELPKEGDDVYKQAGDTLSDWLKNGIMKREDKESFYIYEEDFFVDNAPYTLKGIIARVKVTDFSQKVVIPHENTLSAAKDDRFHLMCATGCNFSNIYCLFDDDKNKITDEIEKSSASDPIYNFSDSEGVTHKLWITNNTEKITEYFKNKTLFIADGHHRYETGIKFRDYMRAKLGKDNLVSDYIMMMLVPMQCDGLVVFPTHRIVHSIENFNGDALIESCKENFTISKKTDKKSLEKHMKEEYNNGRISFGLYCNKNFYAISPKENLNLDSFMPQAGDSLKKLDVSVLHSMILERILKIDKENMAKQLNLSYTRSFDDAVKKVDDGCNCAFFLNPTRVSQIADVGLSGEKMPQKSTYFYPKLITGLVINKFFWEE